MHDLVERAPQMLPLAGAPRMTVLGREVRLGPGRADLIAVEDTGRLAIIEIKLAGSGEARRSVVAQVLSYAAYLQGLQLRQLENDILAGHLSARGADTVLAAVQADDQQHSIDPAAFINALTDCLRHGGFRLVFVLDDAPDELAQLVGYLESLTGQIRVDLITVAAYDIDGSTILVPQRTEPERRTPELTEAEVDARQGKALVTGSTDFRAAIALAPAPHRDMLARLADWADDLHRQRLVNLQTYHGKAGITTLLPRLPGRGGLVSVYADANTGYLQFWRTAFERNAPNALTDVETALGMPVKQGNVTRTVTDQLLDALTNAYREATNTTT